MIANVIYITSEVFIGVFKVITVLKKYCKTVDICKNAEITIFCNTENSMRYIVV